LNSPWKSTPEIKEAVDEFQTQWLTRHELPSDPQIYHYTTLIGMRGILESRAIRLGHISSLNDPSEVQYGQKLIGDAIHEVVEQEDRRDLRTFLNKMLGVVNSLGSLRHHPFVFSFCESSNLLSQWRGYAGGGRGYSLGFNFYNETRIAANLSDFNDGKKPYLRKLIYNRQTQQKLVQDYLQGVAAAAREALGRRLDFEAPEIVMASQAVNLDMLVSFKHPAFEEEGEWRMVRITRDDHDPSGVRFKEADGVLKPYRGMYLYDKGEGERPHFPLRSIRFGPMLEPNSTKAAITLFLNSVAANSHPIGLVPYQVMVNEAGYGLR
jgi:hypothetical protein